MTTIFDDAVLVTYVDGELGPAEAREVEAALLRDARLRKRADLLRESRTILHAAFARIDKAPLPERLLHAIELATLAPSESAARAHGGADWRRFRRLIAMAATIALVFGLGGGYLAAGYRLGRSEATARQSALSEQGENTRLVQATLEKMPSGTDARWQNPDTGEVLLVEPVRTFKDRDGRYCREYRQEVIARDSRGRVKFGMACRHGDGVWRIRYYLLPGEDPPSLFDK